MGATAAQAARLNRGEVMAIPSYLPPPAVSTPYPSTVPSGAVMLYADPKWSGLTLTIYLQDFAPGQQHSVLGTSTSQNSLDNKASWIAFNLPAGTVMTLLETQTPGVAGQPYNFAGAGRCVDLIGNGATQTVDLSAIGANDCLSAFIWRQVDMSAGLFQLFEAKNFGKNRNTFFFGEWSNSVQSLSNWYINDKANSVYFGGIGDRLARIFANDDGSALTDIFAGGSSIVSLADLGGSNGKTSAWNWSAQTDYISLPSVATPYPNLYDVPSGTVILYGDAAWNDNCLPLMTGWAVSGRQYSFVGTALENKATWVAFNLPAGVAMTLLATANSGVAGEPYNFANCGVCVDLIGNGEIQTVDLTLVGADNSLSGYIWRNVNMNDGLFQLFEHENFTGKRNTFFLGEWSQSFHTLGQWAISGIASSAYFNGLSVQSFALYDNAAGTTTSTTAPTCVDFAGWLDIGSMANFKALGFDNKTLGWSWSLLTPLFSTVAPFSVTVENVTQDPSLSVTSTITGSNTGGATIVDEVSVTSENQQSMTLSVSESQTTGSVRDFKWTVEESAEVEGTGEKSSYDINLSFSQDHTRSEDKQTAVTETITLQVDQQIAVPANCAYSSTLTVFFSAIPRTPFTAPGSFYYDQPVPQSVLDPDMSASMNKPIYVVTQDVTGFFGGGIASDTVSSTETTALSAN